MSQNDDGQPPSDQTSERRAKLAGLRKHGFAFPNDFRREHLAGDLHRLYDALTKEELEPKGVRVAVAGRMMLKRVMGKASFATLQDMTGQIQVYVSNDATGAEAHEAFKHWDLGDILGAEGVLFKTRTGELTVNAARVRLLAKSLRPLPEKFHGLADQEQKYRSRYLDLITSEEARRTFAIAQPPDPGGPRLHDRPGLSRGRDADDAADPGRRRSAAVRDAPQRARHRLSISASRPSSI